jgi:hypothetical protein
MASKNCATARFASCAITARFDRREAPQFYPDIDGAVTKHPEPAH